MTDSPYFSRRWLALLVICLGAVMIILDSTVVAVALPSIRADLGFSETSLVWVVNAYVLTFGGFLLLGGLLGDLYGARKLLLLGLVVFTLASLVCGLATSRGSLVWARAVQGLGGAVVDAVSLSILLNMFTESRERAKAMGVFGFVCSVGGTLGVLLGGVVTSSFNWHWIFLINIPLGLLVYILCIWIVPETQMDTPPANERNVGRLNYFGALTVTASLVLAVYTIINSNEAGWGSRQFAGTAAAAVAFMAVFLLTESRVHNPLVPLGLFRSRALLVASVAAALWSAAVFTWFFICALYLQRVLGSNAMQVAIAFLPANLLTAVTALGFSAKLVSRFGIKIPFTAGLLLATLGLTRFVTAPMHGGSFTHILPGMILFGVGGGIVFNPLLLSAMNGIEPRNSGLASGLFNTSNMTGGALGLAVTVTAAAAWTQKLTNSGVDPLIALNGGYHIAFAMSAAFAVVAAALGALFLPEMQAEAQSAR
jgi:EmrB/QacA subfamily drug resistance transporter